MKGCWAAIIRECKGPLTREHIVSRSVLSPSIRVKGLKWCRHELREASASSLTGNILCERHNHALSIVDQEGANVKQALQTVCFDPPTDRAMKSVEYINADARLFIRWLAKSFCNFVANDGGDPSPDFIRFSFGQSSHRTVKGFIHLSPGCTFAPDRNHIFHFEFFSDPDGIVIAKFVFFGFPFLLMNTDRRFLEQSDLPPELGPLGSRELHELPYNLGFTMGKARYEIVFR